MISLIAMMVLNLIGYLSAFYLGTRKHIKEIKAMRDFVINKLKVSSSENPLLPKVSYSLQGENFIIIEDLILSNRFVCNHTTGHDEGEGSRDFPFKTISRAYLEITKLRLKKVEDDIRGMMK